MVAGITTPLTEDNRPTDSRDCDAEVLRWLIHEARRRAAHAIGLSQALPPQPVATELELSRHTIGLLDLVARLDSARAMMRRCGEPALADVVTDLQARTWVAAALLEAMARVASGMEPDEAFWQASITSLAAAYGSALFV